MRHRPDPKTFPVLAFLAVCLLPPGTLAAQAAPDAEMPAVDAEALMPNGRQPWPGVLTGGQPSLEQLDEAARSGVKTVINLRGVDESPIGRADVEARGMAFVSIPIAGAEDLTPAAAQAFREALDAAERPVLVHCAAGNRVGALFALDAFFHGGADAEAAVETGKSAGLTSLEPAVRAAFDGQ